MVKTEWYQSAGRGSLPVHHLPQEYPHPFSDKPEQLSEVHLNIDKPLGPTAIDILRYMHVYDDEPE